jgi:hypothetical protein
MLNANHLTTTIENPFDASKQQFIGVNKGSKSKRKKWFKQGHKDKDIELAKNNMELTTSG